MDSTSRSTTKEKWGGAGEGGEGGVPLHPGSMCATPLYAESIATTSDTVPSPLHPQTFYETYVRLRQPVLLLGQCAAVLNNPNIMQQLNVQTLAKLVAPSFSTKTVEVNQKAAESSPSSSSVKDEENGTNKVGESVGIQPSTSSFSPLHGSVVIEMPVGELFDALLSGSTDYYMTTQTLPTDEEVRPSVVTWLSELLIQQKYLPLRPPLLGHLIPMNAANVWMGCASSSAASSSGLHHDFHDNLYCLIRGCKTIRIAPPSSIYQFTKMVGKLHTLHDNGRMVYHEQLSDCCSNGDTAVTATATTSCPIRPDGADVTVERIVQLEIRKEAIERELASTSSETFLERQKQLNDELDQIEEELLDIEMANPQPQPNSEESNCPDSSTSEDDDEDDDEVFFGTRTNHSPNKQQQKQQPSAKHKRAKISHPDDPNHDFTHSHETAGNEDDLKTTAARVANNPRVVAPPNFVLEEGNNKVQFQTIHMQAGDVLYLPAGWFHGVYSHGTAAIAAGIQTTLETAAASTTTSTTNAEENDDDGIHMAVNYWVHPPDIGTDFDQPYLSAFWQRDWDARGYDSK